MSIVTARFVNAPYLCNEDIMQPWAKCGLLAAAALRPIFCGLIAALSENFFHHMVCNILFICLQAPFPDVSESLKLLGNNDRFSP